MSSQLALPGLAPNCPHCGGRRTELVGDAEADGEVVSGQHWRCRGCGREFWSLPSINREATRR
jgi:transposase-like protein